MCAHLPFTEAQTPFFELFGVVELLGVGVAAAAALELAGATIDRPAAPITTPSDNVSSLRFTCEKSPFERRSSR
jgi:hypothetical protein